MPVGRLPQRLCPELSTRDEISLLVDDDTVGPAGAAVGVEVLETLPVTGGELLEAGDLVQVFCPFFSRYNSRYYCRRLEGY